MDIKPVKIEPDHKELKPQKTKVATSTCTQKKEQCVKNVKSHSKKNPDHLFKCEECCTNANKNKYFQTKYLLKKHIQRCHSSTKYTCEICFKSFQERYTVTRHKRMVHTAADKISCSVCHNIYVNRSSLTKHMFKMHKLKIGNLNYSKCELCSEEFACTSELEAHVVEMHVIDKEFECQVCSKKFIDSQSMDEHIMKIHKSVKTINCDICAVELSSKTALNQHVKQVHSRSHFCSKCKKSFMNESEFNQHLEAIPGNTDARAFKCQICNLICTSQCNFDWHSESHIKQFKSTQKVGIKKEEEELASFKCELCCKCFDRETHLARHRQNIHQISRWKCSFENCLKTFQTIKLLKRHKFYDHGTKKYRCQVCQKPFDVSKNLQSHIRLKHPESEGLMTSANSFHCKLSECSFETEKEKYLATHYQEKHGLPIVYCTPFRHYDIFRQNLLKK